MPRRQLKLLPRVSDAGPATPQGSRSAVRAFPPVLQCLTHPGELLERRLQQAVDEAFQGGARLEQICAAVYARAADLGYEAAIGIQEVYGAGLPSFPEQVVRSAILLVDLRRAAPQRSLRRAG